MLGGQPNQGWQLCFLFNCTPVGRTLGSMTVPTIHEMVGASCFGCCQAHQGLPVGFLLLRYSVYLLLGPYLCFISFLYLDSCVLGDDKFVVLYANQTSMCS